MKKFRKKYRQIAGTFFVIGLFVVITCVIISFVLAEQALQVELVQKRLEENSNRNATIVRKIFDEYIDTLRALAVYARGFEDVTSEETLYELRTLAEAFNYDRLSIDLNNGISYTTDGISYRTLDDVKFFMGGARPFISDVVTSYIDGRRRIRIHVPLVPGESTLSISLTLEQLSSKMEELMPDDYKYFFMVDSNGQFAAISSRAEFSFDYNYFEIIGLIKYDRGFSEESLISAYNNCTGGHTEYSLYGTSRQAFYTPVGINNWLIFSVIPSDVIAADTHEFVLRALTLSIEIALVLIVASIVIFINQKRQKTKAELDEKCFRYLADYTDKMILEWNYDEEIMYISNFEKNFERKPLAIDDILKYNSNTYNEVHPEDSELFIKTHTDIINGRNVEDARIRVLSGNGEYIYYSLSAIVVSDKKGRPHKAIGFLENIDEQIRKEEYLKKKAEADQLTGLYNKSASEQLITKALQQTEPGTSHALICLDLDNFKGINDSFGHLYGDKVLKEISAGLRGMFRKSDILGRFGGDEFILYLPDIPNRDFVQTKVIELNKLVYKTYRVDGVEETISASIGVAISPDNGTSYKQLYEKADEASYKVKHSGKNSYAFAE